MKRKLLALLFFLITFAGQAQRQMEFLTRGLVGVRRNEREIFLSWRLLATDESRVSFSIYRATGAAKAVKLNKKPIAGVTCFIDATADLTQRNTWFLRAIVRGKEAEVDSFSIAANSSAVPYFEVPLKTPDGYSPNDASAADLDGDGNYEIVVHMTGRGKDNSQRGQTDEPILHAYKLDGTLLWSINLGKNIREGAHYTQFLVYDLDGDGRAEVACKTADGTVDGQGKVIGNPEAEYRNEQGYILSGREFLTIFDGLTGAALATTDFIPPRHPGTLEPATEQLKELWGDGYGNRVDRFLGCVAYLDGKRPSLIMTRGYYTRTVLSAWNWRDGELSNVWTFDSRQNQSYSGQGNHNLSVADVDNDGRDEIIFGACTIDDNGTGLYSTGLGHGDALHVTDLDPERPGLEVFDIQERFDDAGAHLTDARTGEVLWKKPSVKAGDDGEGPGRANAFDIDPRHNGAECWVKGAAIEGLFNIKGEKISDRGPGPCNFGIWWDGDLLRELLDKNFIGKWNWQNNAVDTLLVATNCLSNNGTKATPVLSADLFGDWREEVIWRTTDNKSLRIYTTTAATQYRFVTLMHDPVYRLGIAWQNVAYNQPPHTSFFLGNGMKKPARVVISINKRK